MLKFRIDLTLLLLNKCVSHLGTFNQGRPSSRNDCEGLILKDIKTYFLLGSGDGCRKCGQDGHMARDCSLPDLCRFYLHI